ncbi:MAG: fumarate hydrolyase [Lentisphaerae bacterium GWF2_52_8]|nr:MAG: fumarate hydrolyase [Lentisphaerae bacterium GWF2_52_8]
MIELHTPLDESAARNLRVGDQVLISGTIVTGRDSAHSWLLEKERPEMRGLLEGTFIFHCGPVVKRTAEAWRFVASGPTTSIREEPYQADVIAHYGLRGVIGKGGMGEKTSSALKQYGAVYLHAIGGAAALLAKTVVSVRSVYCLEEFGMPEALWVIDVRNFPALVTMDSHGASLHREVLAKSSARASELIRGS